MPVSWWIAAVVVVAGIVALAVGEPVLVRRTGGDDRPVHVQRRNRRVVRWLIAMATVAVAQVSVVTAWAAEVDWEGNASAVSATVALLGLVVAVAAFVVTLRHPARRADVPVPTALGVLAPALVTAAAVEVVFRGALLALLRETALGVVGAVAVSAVAFGLTRLPRGRQAVPAAVVTGAVLGTVVVLTGWVLVAVALHVALLLVVAAAGSRGVRIPAAAAGGATGVGCGSHDPNSPSCAGCPLAAAGPGHGSVAGRTAAPA